MRDSRGMMRVEPSVCHLHGRIVELPISEHAVVDESGCLPNKFVGAAIVMWARYLNAGDDSFALGSRYDAAIPNE